MASSEPHAPLLSNADATEKREGRVLSSEGTIGVGFATFMVVILNTGVAPLTLPYGFEQAGWLMGFILVPVCGFMSLLCSSFVVETLSICNAIRHVAGPSASYKELVESDTRKETDDYFLRDTLEYSQLARMLLPKFWCQVVRLVTCIYIGGACTIWVVAIGNTIGVFFKQVMGPSTETTAYYGALLVALAIEVPLTMMTLSQLKKLQTLMVSIRISAIVIMDSVAIWRLFNNDTNTLALQDNPQNMEMGGVHFEGLRYLFGSAVFTLLWHYSISSVVTPIRPQRSIFRVLMQGTGGMTVFFTLHCLLLAAVWAKPAQAGVMDLVNNNYLVYGNGWLLLGLYPMLVAIAFPIICGNLRGNLLALFNIDLSQVEPERQFNVKLAATLAAVLPPFIIGMITNKVQAVIELNAGFFGFLIQFVFPAVFLLQARKLQSIVLTPVSSKSEPGTQKPLRFPIAINLVAYLAILWGIFGIGMQTYMMNFM